MAGYNLASFGAALKDLFEGPIADAVPDNSYLLQNISDGTSDVEFSGNQIVFPADVAANQSYGINTMDGSAVPSAGARTTVKATVNVANHAITVGLTDEVIQRSKNDQGAFVRATKKIADDASKDLSKRVNQALYGTVLWAVSANSAASVLTLASVQYLRVGDVIVVGNRSTGAITGTRTITARNIAAKTVTVDSNISVTAATDGVWYSGAGPADTNFVAGMQFITGTGRTLYNINSATFPGWDGNDIPAAGAEVGEQTVIKLLDRIFEREIGEADSGLASPTVRSNVAKDLQSQKRFTDANATTLKGGFNALMVNDVPIVRDADSTKSFLFAYKKAALQKVKMGDFGWMERPDGQGGIFVEGRNASGQRLTSWEATFRGYLNVICREPGATGRISAAADTDPVN